MKKSLLLSLCIAMGLTSLWGAREAAAQAPTKYMLTLLDRSSSMSAQRATGETRWVAAKTRSKAKIDLFAASGTTLVSVWSFSDTGYVQHTIGFVSPAAAKAAIDALPGPTGVTPLAKSACDAIDSLINTPATATFQRILQLNSDGEENSTPTTHLCYGGASTIATAPYSTGSWHNKVYTKAAGVVVHVDLFGNNIMSAGQSPVETPTKDAPFTKQEASNAAPTLTAFFQSLSAINGGTYTGVGDATRVPVLGDVNADYCIDDRDLAIVTSAANYGKAVPPADPRADVNFDRKVDDADVLYLYNNYGRGC